MVMTHPEYETWTESLQQQDNDYYAHLLLASPHIISDLEKYKQHKVAEKLHISPPKLSLFKPILEAYLAITTKEV